MFGFVFMLAVIGFLHVVLHIPLIIALAVMAVLWVIWKLKYIILAVIGLDFLLSRESSEDQ